MAGALEAVGKDVKIVNGQATPPNLAFLEEVDDVPKIASTLQKLQMAIGKVLELKDPQVTLCLL